MKKDIKKKYTFDDIKIDGIKPSPEFEKLVSKEKRGKLTSKDIQKVFTKRYKAKDN